MPHTRRMSGQRLAACPESCRRVSDQLFGGDGSSQTTDRSSNSRASAAKYRPHILLIDNYDSFTWNLCQQLSVLGADVVVRKNDAVSVRAIGTMRPDGIVISPGPGNPSQSGISMAVIAQNAGRMPILGVCLGHQCIGALFGSSRDVVRAPRVMHGKTSRIFHDGQGLMRRVPSPFTAARYHSLLLNAVPTDFRLMCWTGTQQKPDLIMGIRHASLPIFGVQFHPESFLTQHGDRITRNFLDACASFKR